jgi:phosphomannomutase
VNQQLDEQVGAWIADDPDESDRATLASLLENGDETELHRRFDAPLTFGTAGLRGPEMAGPAGMNRYTVRRATQGVIAWLAELGLDSSRGVVVGRDGRHGSEAFNDEVVAVLIGAGVRVYEMPGPLPTPLVAYSVKALNAAAGIMITASHNPAQDNGFKLYACDGAQIIPPHDQTVERFANEATTPVLGDRSSPLHSVVPSELWADYQRHFVERFGVPFGSVLRVTYTPLHGVGGVSMMELLTSAGFSAVTPVGAQFLPDGDFPTLAFPNPEEPGALDRAIATADKSSSSLVIANDPDADRLGAAVLGPKGWRILRGDEIGWLLASTLLTDADSTRDVVATSIVSSTMLRKMADAQNVRFAETLTGFKWISRAAGDGVLRFGYEEALGFAVDPLVADKDGMSAGLALCHLAHHLTQQGQTLLDRLDDIESRYGVHAVSQLSFRADGPDALSIIAVTLKRMKLSPPPSLGGLNVSDVVDLESGWHGLQPTEGLVLQLGTHGRVIVRPSGTEPKLKAYVEILGSAVADESLQKQRDAAHELLTAVGDEITELLKF